MLVTPLLLSLRTGVGQLSSAPPLCIRSESALYPLGWSALWTFEIALQACGSAWSPPPRTSALYLICIRSVSALYPLGVRSELLRSRSKPVGAPGVLLRSPSLCIRSVSALYPLGVRSELLRARSQPVAPVFLLSSHKRCVPAMYPLCIRSECAPNFWERAP